jgi:hypothetical protein
MLDETLRKRIYEKVYISPSGCHLWVGALQYGGYGTIRWKGKQYTVTRLLWEQVRGNFPSSLHVLHRCDVPRCVNLEHLFLGTPRDNAQDKLQKGRPNGGGPKRVTAARRDLIKQLYTQGQSWQDICLKASCSTGTIHRVLKGVYDGL